MLGVLYGLESLADAELEHLRVPSSSALSSSVWGPALTYSLQVPHFPSLPLLSVLGIQVESLPPIQRASPELTSLPLSSIEEV